MNINRNGKGETVLFFWVVLKNCFCWSNNALKPFDSLALTDPRMCWTWWLPSRTEPSNPAPNWICSVVAERKVNPPLRLFYNRVRVRLPFKALYDYGLQDLEGVNFRHSQVWLTEAKALELQVKITIISTVFKAPALFWCDWTKKTYHLASCLYANYVPIFWIQSVFLSSRLILYSGPKSILTFLDKFP